jgi:hypothetical protein
MSFLWQVAQWQARADKNVVYLFLMMVEIEAVITIVRKRRYAFVQVTISGTTPACTLYNGYEKVEVILDTMAKDQTTCQYLSTGSVVIRKVAFINLMKPNHGSFSATFENIEYNTAYCMRVSVGEYGIYIHLYPCFSSWKRARREKNDSRF